MKKITLFTLLMMSFFGFSQNWSTGDVTLTTGFTVKFDVDTTTDVVTMTMVGPDDQWLAVAISDNNYTPGATMGQFDGDDTIAYTNNTIRDSYMPAGNGTPPMDSSSDWTLDSNTTAGASRTVIATRARDTGDTNDYIFPTTPPSSFNFVWALGGSGSQDGFGFHAGGVGIVIADNNTLSTPDVNVDNFSYTIAPNPSSDMLNIRLNAQNSQVLGLEVYNVLGKRILKQNISEVETSVNITDWQSGIYLVKISGASGLDTKRFIKN